MRSRGRGGLRQMLVRNSVRRRLGRDAEGVIGFELLRETFPLLASEPVTTGSHAAAWSAVLGYHEVILLGVDASFTDHSEGVAKLSNTEREVTAAGADPNYYFEGYRLLGDRFHQKDTRHHLAAWRLVAARLRQTGVRIWNASSSSKLSLFDYRPFEAFEADRGASSQTVKGGSTATKNGPSGDAKQHAA